MPIDLSSYGSIQTGLFVRIECDFYRATLLDSFTTEVLKFSDQLLPITINSEVYPGLGKLVAVTASTSELRVSNNQLVISISGIPNTSIEEIVASRFKGSSVIIYRAFFNPSTGALLSIAGNPSRRFTGIITNYTLTEDFNYETRSSSNTIAIQCASAVNVLEKKITGRKTNPDSEKFFFEDDLSMDRVPNLVGTYFDFGAS